MIISNFATRMLCRYLRRRMAQTTIRRHADFVIGPQDDPYLLRWWMIPRNRVFNIYGHWFCKDDDDRALHDHPFWSVSFNLTGGVVEHYRTRSGEVLTRTIERGSIVFRSASMAHRIALTSDYAMTLFVTGPRIRSWGFWCPQNRWVHWKDFTAARDGNPGGIGRGCE